MIAAKRTEKALELKASRDDVATQLQSKVGWKELGKAVERITRAEIKEELEAKVEAISAKLEGRILTSVRDIVNIDEDQRADIDEVLRLKKEVGSLRRDQKRELSKVQIGTLIPLFNLRINGKLMHAVVLSRLDPQRSRI